MRPLAPRIQSVIPCAPHHEAKRRGVVQDHAAHQLIRFLAVGLLNTAFGYGVFFAALNVTGHTTLSLAISTTLGVLFNFATTGRLVFANRDPARIWRFIGVYAVLFAVNAAALIALERLGLGAAFGQALLLGPLVILSFLLNRALVFGDAK